MYSGDSTGVIIIWNCSVSDEKRKSKAAADGSYCFCLLVAVISNRLTIFACLG